MGDAVEGRSGGLWSGLSRQVWWGGRVQERTLGTTSKTTVIANSTQSKYCFSLSNPPPATLSAKAAYMEKAKAAGVPAIVSGGIYPGTSNVMAAHIISIARAEYDDNWNYRTPAPGGY